MRTFAICLTLLAACAASSDDELNGGTDIASGGTDAVSEGTTSTSSGADLPSSSTTDPTTAEDQTSSSTAADSTGEPSSTTTDALDTGGSTGDEPLVGCYDYDMFTPTVVGYRADVMPILAARCSGCHSDPNESVYYGMGGTTEAEANAIYDKLLGGVPKQAPHLSFIVPSDPVRSYMMAKVEYDDPGGTCSVIQCGQPGCDLQAPPSAQLPENELAVLRSWVLGGALND